MNIKNYNQLASMVVTDLLTVSTAIAGLAGAATGLIPQPEVAGALVVAGVLGKAAVGLKAAEQAIAPVSRRVLAQEAVVQAKLPAPAEHDPLDPNDDEVEAELDVEGKPAAEVTSGLHPSGA